MSAPGDPTDFNAMPNAEVNDLMFQITPDNVIQIHHAVAAEARLVLAEVGLAQRDAVVGVAAKDPVSQPASEQFNAKINPVVQQSRAYGNALQAVADQLQATITSYGHTEDEITSTFGQYSSDYQKKYSLPDPGPH
jgi:hypothetical protein